MLYFFKDGDEMITFDEIKKNEAIRTYIKKADESLLALGFTEHSFAHVTKVTMSVRYILQTLGYSEREVELASIAAYMHDIGNIVNRIAHSQSGAIMAFRILDNLGMDAEDMSGSLHILESRRQEFIRISEDYEEAVKLREYFEKETPPESLVQLTAPETRYGSLQEREKELLADIARLEETEKDCRNRAEAYEEEAEDYGELSETYQELTGRLEAKKQEHFYITETLKCLKKAKEQFSSRYMKGLSEGFERYVSLLGGNDLEKTTDGHYTGIHTDVNLNVQVTAYGEDKELGYFSTGFRDYIGLCMRFALVDAMFKEEKPFLVLDDPFVNLDKEKLDRSLGFLKEASEEYQILYLVCHDSRA